MRLLSALPFSYSRFAARRFADGSQALTKRRGLSTTLFFGGRQPVISVLLTGVVWGTGFVVPVAAFYHFSGLRGAVDQALVVLAEISQARALAHARDGKPSQALSFLRVAAKTYVQGYPFAPFLVDRAFDAVDGTVDAHAKEAALVIENLGAKMTEIVEHQKTVTLPAVVEIVKVVQTETEKLHEGAWKAASNPELHDNVRKAVEGAGKDVVKFAENAGKTIAGLLAGKAPNVAKEPSDGPEAAPNNELQVTVDGEAHVVEDSSQDAAVDEPRVVALHGSSAVKKDS